MSAEPWLIELHRNFAKHNIAALSPKILRAEERHVDPADTDRLHELFIDLVQRERGSAKGDLSDYRIRIRKPGSTVWGWYSVDPSGRPQLKR